MLRTHTCGQLSKTNENEEVVLTGWVNVRRDHGGLIFLDIRDRYGVTQTTFYPDDQKSFEIADRVKPESVVMVKGQVIARPQEMINKKLKTGEIEVKATSIEVLSASKTPPFELDKADGVDEEIRLKYRYLDLRRQKMQHNLEFRQQVLTHIRNYLVEKDFIEVETPLLTSSSPEGARDYLVPSRVHPGQFYALPQAPQLYKQLLMVASFDKYFQIAPCFRDEDARADRSPGEFYQLDLEMSFVDKEDVFEILEPLMIELTEGLAKKKVQNKTFPIVTYKDALEKYGTDKPDLRFDMTFVDITEQAHESDFKVFQSGECIKGIKVDGGAKYSRKDIDNLIEKAQEFGAKGLAWVKIKDNKFESQIAKFFKEEVQQAIIKKFAAQDGDFVCFIADSLSNTQQILGDIRNHLGEIEGLKDDQVLAFAWIIDFPMYEKNKETGKIDFGHNPFSMPQGGAEALEAKNPYGVLAEQYDLVCNGIELSSGALRNYKPELLEKAFAIVGYKKDDFWNEFGHLAKAFEYGAPPHGGIAPGIERLLMLLLGEKNIREVVAFPKNQKAQDLVLGAPEKISEKRLKELNIKLDIKNKK